MKGAVWFPIAQIFEEYFRSSWQEWQDGWQDFRAVGRMDRSSIQLTGELLVSGMCQLPGLRRKRRGLRSSGIERKISNESGQEVSCGDSGRAVERWKRSRGGAKSPSGCHKIVNLILFL
ncbi:hypothetical protein L3Y34_004604 [Caenorhabditis briggsae]|nr:hypothetical protein L3Y34_004604 [Caenorhabditis briggsae]